MLLFGFADKLQIKLHLNFNQASLGAAPHMRASHHPLLLERVSQRNLWPYEGIPHNIRIMFTNSAHMCSNAQHFTKVKSPFPNYSNTLKLGIFLFLLPFLYQIVGGSHVEYINEVFNSSPLVQWVHYESMTLMIIPTVLNAFEQLLVHMLPHSPWQELRLLVAANVLASKLWDRYSGWGPECEFLRQTTSKYIDHGFLEPETRTYQYILCSVSIIWNTFEQCDQLYSPIFIASALDNVLSNFGACWY